MRFYRVLGYFSTLFLLLFSLANSASYNDLELISRKRSEFIWDIQRLLSQNEEFYNKYGVKDEKIDFRFQQAKEAAHYIFNHADLFADRIRLLQITIEETLNKQKSQEQQQDYSSSGNIFIVDKCLLVISTLTGYIRFQE